MKKNAAAGQMQRIQNFLFFPKYHRPAKLQTQNNQK
jgi:hypothetical protein